ncbi:DUF4276 family protein [Actinomadura roseirufa]|uniref:DUF4276 family protein n=1 Tax=Actinomadura roseirufa TaxID=2094049 RepID=UPI00104181F2|nr:DUF4276 family protein [Actinomadura roseirufa]
MESFVLSSIVEGHGEVAALPVMLRRLCARANIYNVAIPPPVRIPRNKMFQGADLKRALLLSSKRVTDTGGIFVLFDSDDDCPVDAARQLRQIADELKLQCPIALVAAQREYESIFLAALPSLIASGTAKPSYKISRTPESIRGAKEEIRRALISEKYKETQEQERLTAKIDLEEALTCRWLQKLDRELRVMLKVVDS